MLIDCGVNREPDVLKGGLHDMNLYNTKESSAKLLSFVFCVR